MNGTCMLLLFGYLLLAYGQPTKGKPYMASWREGANLCTGKGGMANLQLLKVHMIQNKISSAWVNVTRNPDYSSIGSNGAPKCTYIDIRDGHIGSCSCVSNKHAFACQFNDCSKCPQKQPCKRWENSCFYISCRNTDWASARQECSTNSGEIITEKEKILCLIKDGSSKTKEGCIKYWIGNDSLETTENNSATDRDTYNQGMPSAAECWILSAPEITGSDKYELQHVSCEQVHHYYCQSEIEASRHERNNWSHLHKQTSPLLQELTTVSVPTCTRDTKEYTHTKKSGSPSLLKIVVPCVAVVVVMVIGVAVCFIHRIEIFHALRSRSKLKFLKRSDCRNGHQREKNKSGLPVNIKEVSTVDKQENQQLISIGN